jgi:ABC-2 type transport system permease protein
MRLQTTFLIALQLWRNAFKTTSLFLLPIIFLIMGYAAYSGWKTYTQQNNIREHYQHEARESWESNPDKHPHRMAHYGSFAFRLKHPLSMFDFGMESFTGNAVYLEAHKQNTVNFSEASFSTGLLRFGEISMAMVLQVVIPLVIFFLGFASIAADRENGTLKIIITQGATWKDILFGKSLGLMALAMLFFIPAAIITACLLAENEVTEPSAPGRYIWTLLIYFLFYFVVCVITVLTSAVSRSSKDALIRLLGLWLFFIILLPRTTQALGNYFYPSPSRVAFESAIEEDILRLGDSHNPDDAHYKAIKDSLLLAHQIDSVHKLPFNYSGLIMREGEKLSAQAYAQHLSGLLNTYADQNRLNRITALINPYTAVRNISMAMAGTDFYAYVNFQHEAEAYRYNLAQTMNELQMKYISNEKPKSGDKPYAISRAHWQEFPDFQYRFQSLENSIRQEAWSITSLLIWTASIVLLIITLSKKLKAI